MQAETIVFIGELALGVIIIGIIVSMLATAAVIGLKSLSNKTHQILRKRDREKYVFLERKQSWRIVKVLYFVISVSLAAFFLFKPYYYQSDSLVGYGFVTLVLVYPGFLLTRRLFVYIAGTETQK